MQLSCSVPMESDGSSTATTLIYVCFRWAHFLISLPLRASFSLTLPASLKPATKLLLVKEVTTGCGHHTKEKCHLLESCRQGLVLCPTFLLLPFSLGTPTHSRSGPQFSLLPSRDLCGPAAQSQLLPHSQGQLSPHTSPEGWLI